MLSHPVCGTLLQSPSKLITRCQGSFTSRRKILSSLTEYVVFQDCMSSIKCMLLQIPYFWILHKQQSSDDCWKCKVSVSKVGMKERYKMSTNSVLITWNKGKQPQTKTQSAILALFIFFHSINVYSVSPVCNHWTFLLISFHKAFHLSVELVKMGSSVKRKRPQFSPSWLSTLRSYSFVILGLNFDVGHTLTSAFCFILSV